MLKLGITVSQTSIRNILNKNGIVPVPVRNGSIGWRHLMNHHKAQIFACDFFTIETIWLKTLYIFFFIELGTRRIHLAGITSKPNSAWVAQQARQLMWELGDKFDCVFESEGVRVIPTLLRAPNANTYAERWVRTVREECLDHILIINELHLQRVLKEYIGYYERARPHQGLNQQMPVPRPSPNASGPIQKRQVLGGIIKDYYRAVPSSPSYLH